MKRYICDIVLASRQIRVGVQGEYEAENVEEVLSEKYGNYLHAVYSVREIDEYEYNANRELFES